MMRHSSSPERPEGTVLITPAAAHRERAHSAPDVLNSPLPRHPTSTSLPLQGVPASLPSPPFTRKPINTSLVAEYLSLMETYRILRELNTLKDSTVATSEAPLPNQRTTQSLPSRSDLTPSPDLYFLNTAAEDASEVAPKVAEALTDLVTAVGEAISSFIQAVAEAISTFLQDLAAAIEEKPAVLLLGLIPLFFLLLSLFTSGKFPGHAYAGVSHGVMSGYSGRSVFSSSPSSPATLLLDVSTAEALATHILTQVEAFEARLKPTLPLKLEKSADHLEESVDSLYKSTDEGNDKSIFH